MTTCRTGMRPRLRSGLMIALILGLVLGLAGPAQGATVADLGALVPSGLNAKDQVVGDVSDPNDPTAATHAALWSNGTLTPLPEPSGATQSDALAINASGRIVGDSNTHAEFWNGPSAPTQIGPIFDFGPGGDFSQANGVDAAGDVAGFTVQSSTPGRGRAHHR
jgi:uncharacterized membrane protein